MREVRARELNNNLTLPLLEESAWKAFIASVPPGEHVWLTVANYGYLDLLLNLYYTLQRSVTDQVRAKFVVITPDQRLVSELKIYPCIRVFHINYRPWVINGVSSNAVAFKQDDWNAITRFKLLAIHAVLKSGRPVFYVDPDIAFIQDPSEHIKKLRADTFYTQEGDPYCTGVIVSHPTKHAEEIFEPDSWRMCGQDDETYVKIAVKQQISKRKIDSRLFETLDFKMFPNGKMWKVNALTGVEQATAAVQESRCLLFHFNHISGIEAKIERMRDMKCFYPVMKVAKVPEQFKPALASVCVERNGSTYPPHHQPHEDHLEEACEKIVNETMQTRLISSTHIYLPIHWTAISVTKDKNLLSELQDWCQRFFETHKKDRFWTVVQHCKGLFGSCGVAVPKSLKIFMTSDPHGAVSLSFNDRNLRRMPLTPKRLPPGKPNPKAEAMRRATQTQHNSVNRTRQPTAMERQRVAKFNQAWERARGRTAVSTTNAEGRRQSSARQVTPQRGSGMEQPCQCITVPLVSGKHTPPVETVTRNVLASFQGCLEVHPLRQELRAVMSNIDDIVVRNGLYRSDADVKSFRELMQRSVFALCPRGFGTTSFRLTEAMDYGCIPVYISDKFSIPFEDHPDFNIHDVCILVTPDKIGDLEKRLRSITMEEMERMRANIERHRERFFTLEGCCRTIVFDYIDGKN